MIRKWINGLVFLFLMGFLAKAGEAQRVVSINNGQSTSGYQGTQVTLPITIDESADIAVININVTYDTTVLDYDKTSIAGSIIANLVMDSDWIWLASEETPGTINIVGTAFDESDPVTLPAGGGLLFNVTFDIIGNPGDSCVVGYDQEGPVLVDADNNRIAATGVTCDVTVKGYSISGTVNLVGGIGSVTDVVLTLEATPVGVFLGKGKSNPTTQPDALGAYSFVNLAANYIYKIIPALTGYSFTPADRTYEFGGALPAGKVIVYDDVTGADFTGNAQAMVSGATSYGGVQTGDVNIGLFATDNFTGDPLYGVQAAGGVGAYAITNVAPGTYYVANFMDVDDDDVWDQADEPFGTYAGNPITLGVGQQLTGIDITLKEPLTLTIVSPYGNPVPAEGNHVYYTGDYVNASVTTPFAGGPGERYVIIGETGTGSAPTTTGMSGLGFTINQDSSITWNWQQQFELTATVDPVNAGVVNETGWTYGEGWYNAGDDANIEAVANANFIFREWTGDAAGANAATTVTMNAPKSVTAHFDPLYTLTTDVSPAGGGTVAKDPDDAQYRSGTVVALTATPNAGYRFNNWTGGVADPNSITTTVTMDADKTVTANFVRQYILTMAVNIAGAGEITPVEGESIQDEGSVVNITANPGLGYVFVNWTGGAADPNAPQTTVTMDADKTITANFARAYSLDVVSAYGNPDPSVGTHGYVEGAQVTASVASPVAGVAGERFVCTGWTGTGSVPVTGGTNTVTFTLNENSTITWLWQRQYSLTTDITGNGEIQQQVVGNGLGKAPSTTWYDEGTQVQLTAVETDDDYLFGYWEGDVDFARSKDTSMYNPLSVPMDMPRTITAVFLEKNPVLAVEPTELTFVFDLTKTNGNQQSADVTITNEGAVGDLEWEIGDIVYNEGTNWITVVPDSGTVPPGGYAITAQKDGNSQIIVLTVDSTDKTGGVYTATVPVTSNGGDDSIDVTMVIIQRPETIEPPLPDTNETEALPFIPFTAQFYRSTTGGTVNSNWVIEEYVTQCSLGKQGDTKVIFEIENEDRALNDNNVAQITVPWGLFKPGVWYRWRVSDNDMASYLPKGKPEEDMLWSDYSVDFQVNREVPDIDEGDEDALRENLQDVVDTCGADVLKDPETEELLLVTLPQSTGGGQQADSITLEVIDPDDVEGSGALSIDYVFDLRIEGVTEGDTVVFQILVPGNFTGSFWKYNPDEEQWQVFPDVVNQGTVTAEDGSIYTVLEVTITDGGEWDFDGAANGVIADPMGVDVFTGVDKISGGSGGCFIATAAYGSPFERHVKILREFRDRYLMTSAAGRAFVRWYYIHSPKYAAVIAGNEVLRTVARVALTPLYGVAYTVVNGLLPYIMLAFGLFLLALRRRAKKAVVTMLAAGILLGVASTSFAAETNHFKVAPAEEYTVMVPTTKTVGEKKLAVDLFYSYADNPLQGEVGGTEIDLIENQSLLNAGITLGLTEFMQVSLTIPYVFNQSTEAPIEKDGLGDIILGGKYRFREGETGNLAIAPYVQLPVGNEDAGLGADDWGVGIRGIYDRKINENTLFTANLGYAYQPSEDLAQIEIEHSILFGVGIVYDMPDTPAYIAGEIYGRSEELFDTESTPVEALLYYGYKKEKVSFVIGGGVEVIDGYGSSSWRVFTGVRLGL